MPALVTALESIDQEKTPAAAAFSQANEVTLRQAAAKHDQFFELYSRLRIASAVSFVRFTQPLSKVEGDDLGN